MVEYDVVIIGAGPAGLSCAIELQNSDKKILLVEKNKEIGPKSCAGGLTTKIKDFGIPLDIAEILFSEVLISVSEKTLTVSNERIPFVGTIDRGKLGKFLLKKLSDKVTVLRGCEVSQVGDNLVVAGGKKIKYKYLVGADGSNSKVRKFLGLKNNKFLMAIQYLLPANYKNLEICFDTNLFSSGYGWIFPHKGYTSVGCCQDVRSSRQSALRKGFEQWLSDKQIDVKDEKLQGWTISFDYQGFEFGNKFLVGDAGGFASGLTGEGIYFGLISGRDVARKIIDPNYKCEEILEILKIKRRHENTLAITSFFIGVLKSCSNKFFKSLLGFAKIRWISKRLIKYFG